MQHTFLEYVFISIFENETNEYDVLVVIPPGTPEQVVQDAVTILTRIGAYTEGEETDIEGNRFLTISIA